MRGKDVKFKWVHGTVGFPGPLPEDRIDSVRRLSALTVSYTTYPNIDVHLGSVRTPGIRASDRQLIAAKRNSQLRDYKVKSSGHDFYSPVIYIYT